MSCVRLHETSTGEEASTGELVPTPPHSPGTGVPHSKSMGKVKLIVRLGGLRMHNNPNNNSRQKDLKAAGQLAPAWQIMRNAVQKQMMAAALGQQSRAAKDNFNVRQQQQLIKSKRRSEGESSTSFVGEVEDASQLEGVKLWEQGDATMYSQEAIDERYQLRHVPEVRQMLLAWWGSVQELLQASGLETNRLYEREYKVVFGKIYKLMMPAEDYDVAEARVAVHDDWEADSAGVGYLTCESFCEAIFELADVWTLTTEKSEYASFLSELHTKVTRGGRFLPDAMLVTGSGKPEGFEEAMERAEEEVQKVEHKIKQINKKKQEESRRHARQPARRRQADGSLPPGVTWRSSEPSRSPAVTQPLEARRRAIAQQVAQSFSYPYPYP